MDDEEKMTTYIVKHPVPEFTGAGDADIAPVKVLEVMLNTGSTIYQGACKKRGSTLKDEYRHAAGIAYMDPKDMARIGVNNWDTGLVKTDWGEVVVYVAHSRDAPHEGSIFIPKGPWANVVVSPETYSCSDPTYKGVFATIEKTDEEPLLMADLMAEVYEKYTENEGEASNKIKKLADNINFKGGDW